MRKLLALAFVTGCSTGSDEPRTFSGAQALDQATLENHVYYIDLSVADTPLTIEEVGDDLGAIPVRLLAGNDYVVAIGLDPALGPTAMDRVMGAWKLNRDLQPNGEIGDTTGSDPGSPVVGDRIARPVGGSSSGDSVLVVEWEVSVGHIDPNELDILVEFHPGCI